VPTIRLVDLAGDGRRDDDPAAARRLHVARGMFHGGVDGREIDLDDAVPMVIVEHIDRPFGDAPAGRRQEARPGIDAGISEDHIDPAMALGHGIEGLLHAGTVGHIDHLPPYIAAIGLEFGNDAVEQRRIEIENTDPRAVIRHDLGVSTPDTAGAAGNNDRLAANVEHLLQCRHSSPPDYKEANSGQHPF
jgi:hypothetical protein